MSSDKLIVFHSGGYDGGQRLNSMECYDPSIKKWTSLTSMHTRRSAVGCAAMDGKIYVVGGYDGTSSLSSIEVYEQCALAFTVSH